LDLGGLMIVAFSVGLVYTFEFGRSPFILAVVVSFRYAEYVVCMAWACIF
jgi:putative Ca2+/H+ antiporter (TMEM165/GDT1 family)